MAGRGRRAQWLIALLTTTAATAAPPSAPTPAPAPAAEAADTAQAELLDYLSEFEDADGRFVDPAELPPGAELPQAEDDDDPR